MHLNGFRIFLGNQLSESPHKHYEQMRPESSMISTYLDTKKHHDRVYD